MSFNAIKPSQMLPSQNDSLSSRLKSARLRAGFATAVAACEQFGWALSKYRAHENGQNEFKVKDAQEYAKAFEVSAGWLLTGDAEPPDLHKNNYIIPVKKEPQNIEKLHNFIRLAAIASVGVWREFALTQDTYNQDGSQRVAPIDPRFSTDHQFDVIVQGNGFNKYASEGSLLRCIDIKAPNIDINDGDLVVIERKKESLVEISAKRVRKNGNGIELINETDDPRLMNQVLLLNAPNEEISIIGKILWSYRNLDKSISS